MTIIDHWHRLLRVSVESISLEVLQNWLDKAQSTLISI